MDIKQCALCDKLFKPKSKGQEYCSDKCWKKANYNDAVTHVNGEPVW